MEPYRIGRLLATTAMLANDLDEPVKNGWTLSGARSSKVFSDALTVQRMTPRQPAFKLPSRLAMP